MAKLQRRKIVKKVEGEEYDLALESEVDRAIEDAGLTGASTIKVLVRKTPDGTDIEVQEVAE